MSGGCAWVCHEHGCSGLLELAGVMAATKEQSCVKSTTQALSDKLSLHEMLDNLVGAATADFVRFWDLGLSSLQKLGVLLLSNMLQQSSLLSSAVSL